MACQAYQTLLPLFKNFHGLLVIANIHIHVNIRSLVVVFCYQ